VVGVVVVVVMVMVEVIVLTYISAHEATLYLFIRALACLDGSWQYAIHSFIYHNMAGGQLH